MNLQGPTDVVSKPFQLYPHPCGQDLENFSFAAMVAANDVHFDWAVRCKELKKSGRFAGRDLGPGLKIRQQTWLVGGLEHDFDFPQ